MGANDTMQRKRLGFMQLTIMVGFVLFYAGYLMIFLGPFFYFPSNANFLTQHLGQVLFFTGVVIGNAFIIKMLPKLLKVIDEHGSMLSLILFVFVFVLALCIALDYLSVQIPLPVIYICCLLAGFSVAFQFMLWDDLAHHGNLNNSLLDHAIIFVIGTAIFILVALFTPAIAQSWISIIVLLLSILLYDFVKGRCRQTPRDPIEPAKDYFKAERHLDLITVIINFAFGVAFIALYYLSGKALLFAVLLAGVADVTLCLFARNNVSISFIAMLRVNLLVVILAYLACTIDNFYIHVIALTFVIISWISFRTVNASTLTNTASYFKLSILFFVNRGKLAVNLGFTIGLLAGTVVCLFIEQEVFKQYFFIAMAGIFVFSALILLPFKNETSTAGYQSLALSRAEVIKSSDPVDYEERRLRFAKAYRFSNRETDVLKYVLKGRNAKHIAEQLYITESTAKTHISNIYRKTDVHSQQALLDLFEKHQ